LGEVRTYLRHEFSRIHREHPNTLQKIPTPWPSPEILEILVEKSSGYFIYASTVIKFVDDEYSRPSQQLDIIIRNLVPHDTESPFEALDQLLYLFIQFVGHASQGGLTATNFGRCHTSPRRLTNMSFVTVSPENGSRAI
jgi:hypothetical protein